MFEQQKSLIERASNLGSGFGMDIGEEELVDKGSINSEQETPRRSMDDSYQTPKMRTDHKNPGNILEHIGSQTLLLSPK